MSVFHAEIGGNNRGHTRIRTQTDGNGPHDEKTLMSISSASRSVDAFALGRHNEMKFLLYDSSPNPWSGLSPALLLRSSGRGLAAGATVRSALCGGAIYCRHHKKLRIDTAAAVGIGLHLRNDTLAFAYAYVASTNGSRHTGQDAFLASHPARQGVCARCKHGPRLTFSSDNASRQMGHFWSR